MKSIIQSNTKTSTNTCCNSR